MGDMAKLSNPNEIIAIAAGPPVPNLVPQKKGEGLVFGGKYVEGQPRRFIFKAAHMSGDDYRIFDAEGRLVCNSWHQGKNPYQSLDPLDLGHSGPKQEWESLCKAAGYQGMPGFKVKPKMASSHGRQFIMGHDNKIFFSVAKESRLKTMSLRHNLEVCQGKDGDKVMEVVCDLSGRTMQFMNQKDEQIVFVQKSLKALIQTAALGSGSELVVDVAPGVDWTSVLAVLIGIQQVGAHFIKDVAGNFIMPQVQDAALQAAGLDGVANQIGQTSDKLTHNVAWANNIYKMFQQA